MPVNKVIFGNQTVIDISDGTAVATDVSVGKFFYAADGTKTIGTLVGGDVNINNGATVEDDTLVVDDSSSGEGGGGITPTGTISITANGTVDVTNYASADVNVPIPSGYIIPTGSTSITSNGTHDVSQYASASVNVQPSLQSKTATPSESQQTISPDSNYDGLSSVTVGAISSTYIGSGITRQAGSTVTPSTSSQTVSTNGKYMTGDITVNPIPSNYITTTDATASANDILSGETAYVNGNKLTGTLEVHNYYTGSSDPSSSTGSDGDLYLKVSS